MLITGYQKLTRLSKRLYFLNLVGESAVGIEYREEKNVIISAFFRADLILLLRVQVPIADNKERLEVVVLLGDAQPCVPDHISHLTQEHANIASSKNEKSTYSRVSRSRDDKDEEGERRPNKEGKILNVNSDNQDD